MAKVIDFPTPGRNEVQGLNTIVYKQVIYDSTLSDLMTVRSGVQTDDREAWVDPLTKIGKKSRGCSPTNDSPTAKLTEKKWALNEFDFRIVQCYKDLQNTLYNMGLKEAAERGDLSGTQWMQFLEMLLKDAIEQMYLRFGFFGDKEAATFANGGILTNETDPDFYNVVDGVFKQIEEMQADPTGDGKGLVITPIANNALTTRTAQFGGWVGYDVTTGANALRILDTMILKAPRLLARQPDQVVYASKFLLDKAKEQLLTLPSYTESQFGISRDGFGIVHRLGMPIVEVPFWDDIISTDFIQGSETDDDAPYYKPFRALYTTKSNLVMGVPNTSTMGYMKMWYENKERQYYIEGIDDVDVMVMRPDLISIAW